MKKFIYILIALVLTTGNLASQSLNEPASNLTANIFLPLDDTHTHQLAKVYWLPDYLSGNNGYNDQTNDGGKGPQTCASKGKKECLPPFKGVGKHELVNESYCYMSCTCQDNTTCTSEFNFTSPPANAIYSSCIEVNSNCSSDSRYKINSCKEGYELSNGNCVVRNCPSGFTAGLNNCPYITDRYETNGYSGSSICGKCTNTCSPDHKYETCPVGANCSESCGGKIKVEGCKNGYEPSSGASPCEASKCPNPYVAGVTQCANSWDLYTQNGYSGEQVCGLCSCTATDCSAFTSDTIPANANYDTCNSGCGNNTQRYKITSCLSGFELQGGTCVYKPATCEQSLLNAGYALVYNENDYIAAYNARKEVVLMESLVLFTFSNINNNIYTLSSLRGRFPLCPDNKASLASLDTGITIDASDSTINIYPKYSDDSYGSTIHNSVNFMGGGFFDMLFVDKGKTITLNNETYSLNYDGIGGNHMDLIISNGAVLIYSELTSPNSVTLSNNGCLSDGYGYKVCSPSQANISPITSSYQIINNPLACETVSNGVYCVGSITTNCPSDTTPALLTDPNICPFGQNTIYTRAYENRFCPINFTSNRGSLNCSYGITESSKYPGCYACNASSSEIANFCASNNKKCLDQAESDSSECKRKAENDKQNCFYRANEAYNQCMNVVNWWAVCSEEQSAAIKECNYQYTYHDMDWCDTQLRYERNVCDDKYNICMEGNVQKLNLRGVGCTKCI